jgi:predicted nucleic acid-binding protein
VSAFIDTNILVYSVTDDPQKARANQAIGEGGFISAQVLNEFVSVMRGKLKVEWSVIEFALARFREVFDAVLPLTAETNSAALVLARDHRLNCYDALIVASAMEARCDRLLTDDMQHDRMFGGLRIVNPFVRGE